MLSNVVVNLIYSHQDYLRPVFSNHWAMGHLVLAHRDGDVYWFWLCVWLTPMSMEKLSVMTAVCGAKKLGITGLEWLNFQLYSLMYWICNINDYSNKTVSFIARNDKTIYGKILLINSLQKIGSFLFP